jgi:uncharacterized protein (DUF697 family)
MFQKISKNGVGLILLIASIFSLDIDTAMAENIVAAITLLVSTGLMLWNQVSRQDIASFLFRK